MLLNSAYTQVFDKLHLKLNDVLQARRYTTDSCDEQTLKVQIYFV